MTFMRKRILEKSNENQWIMTKMMTKPMKVGIWRIFWSWHIRRPPELPELDLPDASEAADESLSPGSSCQGGQMRGTKATSRLGGDKVINHPEVVVYDILSLLGILGCYIDLKLVDTWDDLLMWISMYQSFYWDVEEPSTGKSQSWNIVVGQKTRQVSMPSKWPP